MTNVLQEKDLFGARISIEKKELNILSS